MSRKSIFQKVKSHGCIVCKNFFFCPVDCIFVSLVKLYLIHNKCGGGGVGGCYNLLTKCAKFAVAFLDETCGSSRQLYYAAP